MNESVCDTKIVEVVTAYIKDQNQIVASAEHNEDTSEGDFIPSERPGQLVGMSRR